MKQILLSALFALFITSAAIAQVPNFTVTDLDGVEHDLYTYLEEGKVVVLDCSATWCPPCWAFHEGNYLKDIHEKYGPDGTDQVVVIFYEADANTGQADLEGTTNTTQGNWLEGVTYPVVDESPISLSNSVFWPQGFPTINVIRPSDKTIISDLYDPWVAGGGLPAMEEIIESAFPVVSIDELETVNIAVFPNPVTSIVQVNTSSYADELSSIEIVDIKGAVIVSQAINSSSDLHSIELSSLVAGNYVVVVKNNNEIIGTKQIVKE